MSDGSPQSKLVPFLKWAGGKRWLTARYPQLFPEKPGHLVEPFCGSAAIFFAISPATATLSDANARLMECYKSIRDEVDTFLHHFDAFSALHSRSFYYDIRDKVLRTSAERAAQFVYLNRVCFNGIYRENLAGIFNVPLGTKSTPKLKSDDFYAISSALQAVAISHGDFEQPIDAAQPGDLLYLDPPYVTKHNFNGFIKYNQTLFSWADQERLAAAVIRAHQRGVSVILSNADHADIRALYSVNFRIIAVERSTVIASSAQFRGRTTEMVATNVL